MSHLADGIRQVVVLLQEVEGAESQQLKAETHVAVVVEPVEHPDTQTARQEERQEGENELDDLSLCQFPD